LLPEVGQLKTIEQQRQYPVCDKGRVINPGTWNGVLKESGSENESRTNLSP
jgi:hypothetical protein